jgi:hypothetical protein
MSPKKGSQRSIEDFLERWERSGASERANYQLFLSELCDLLEVPRPDPATDDAEPSLKRSLTQPMNSASGHGKQPSSQALGN